MFVANMRYRVGISNPIDHFVRIDGEILNTTKGELSVQLPAWRPGRYELANYAKNIRCFAVSDATGKAIAFEKTTKDCWLLKSAGIEKVYISYEYYANQPDAGASYVSEQFLYLNPVNCFMYVVGQMNTAFELELQIPENWQIACQLPIVGNSISASSFDALADSPFFASPNLQHHQFAIGSSQIHFWFEGAPGPALPKLEADTRAYALRQIEIFEELPLADYHFLYLLHPIKFRHGVEHQNSTVIAMGPWAEVNELEFYHDLLAISSHELFHLWNIKRIRPVEMLPYDFTKENYSQLGYVYEGITTYYGDLMLYRSGVWDFKRYATSFAADLEKHFNNAGRFNYSVAQSSFDTWLDGYTPGVKARKVSIYTEGLVAAFIADMLVLEASNGKYGLDEVLKQLYAQTYKLGKGYTKELYQQILEAVAGVSFETYFINLIDGKGNWDDYLDKAMNCIGLVIKQVVDNEGIVHIEVIRNDEYSSKQRQLFELWSK
jgi:predicted metalloprotease with PDZ domain